MKLLGNLLQSLELHLTRSTWPHLGAMPDARVLRAMMEEAQTVAEAWA